MKNGKKPENNPTKGIIISDSFSAKTKLEKNNIEIITINRIFGKKDETVRPYRDEINKYFRLGLILSRVILRIIIAVIKPKVNNQNKMFIIVFNSRDVNSVVIICSQ